MHPSVRALEAGTCPLCGMALVPLAHVSEVKEPLARVTLSESARIRAGIRTVAVVRETADTIPLRLFGRVVATDKGDDISIELRAYEPDVHRLTTGLHVSVGQAGSDEIFPGRIVALDGRVDPRTRTKSVRVSLGATQARLVIGSNVEATVSTRSAEASPLRLIVPATAPLFTGRRALVYVKVPHMRDPSYAARVVELGPRTESGAYRVLSGLTVGDHVVEHGAFVLDSEAQLRNIVSMMSIGDDVNARPPSATEWIPGQIVYLTPLEWPRPLGRTADAYIDLHRALAASDVVGAKIAARHLLETSESFRPKPGSRLHVAWLYFAARFESRSRALVEAKDLDDARRGFAALSEDFIHFLRVFGNPIAPTLRIVDCPMANGGRGASWVQLAQAVENPYFGEAMYRCGTLRTAIEGGAHPSEEQSQALERSAERWR